MYQLECQKGLVWFDLQGRVHLPQSSGVCLTVTLAVWVDVVGAR